jgi:hypothetical protein
MPTTTKVTKLIHIPLMHAQSGELVVAELRDQIEDRNLSDWRTPVLDKLGHGWSAIDRWFGWPG